MLVTLSGIVILFRPTQPEKALSPMLLTLSGIVMPVRRLHAWKADPPYTDDAVWEGDALKFTAAVEGAKTDTGNAIRNRDAGQALASEKGFSLNAGDRFAFDSVRND